MNYLQEFTSLMVQTLNLILLTAPELSPLRKALQNRCYKTSELLLYITFIILYNIYTYIQNKYAVVYYSEQNFIHTYSFQARASEQEKQTFSSLFFCWSHNPVATFGLCLLAQCYDLSARLILKFAEVDVTVLLCHSFDKL